MSRDPCPICSSLASCNNNGRDALQVDCPRCGRFLMTGTAIAMLHARIEKEPRAAARASHIVRSRYRENRFVEIDSTNIDCFTNTPLPPIDVQINNLLHWISNEVKDNYLGLTDLPKNLSDLAGVVGAIDAAGVQDIIDLAYQRNVVSIPQFDAQRIKITPEGWQQMQGNSQKPRKQEDSSSNRILDDENRQNTIAIIKAHCPNCGPDRNVSVRVQHSERWDDDDIPMFTIDNYRILKCAGCDFVFVQKEEFFSEDSDVKLNSKTGQHEEYLLPKISYWPPPQQRKQPIWLSRIPDESIRVIFDEVYLAMENDLLIVAAMGIRAILDKILDVAGADPADNFRKKLDSIEDKGVIGKIDKDILLVMTDAGSAASHRGWRPTLEELESILDATENFVHRVQFQPIAADKLKSRVPPRPAKKTFP